MIPISLLLIFLLNLSVFYVDAMPQLSSKSSSFSVKSQSTFSESSSKFKGTQHPLFKSAQEAVKDKNCFGDYTGEVSMTHKIVSSCFAGGFVEEVQVHPSCTEGLCDNIKPIAKVIYACDTTTKPRVKCL